MNRVLKQINGNRLCELKSTRANDKIAEGLANEFSEAFDLKVERTHNREHEVIYNLDAFTIKATDHSVYAVFSFQTNDKKDLQMFSYYDSLSDVASRTYQTIMRVSPDGDQKAAYANARRQAVNDLHEQVQKLGAEIVYEDMNNFALGRSDCIYSLTVRAYFNDADASDDQAERNEKTIDLILKRLKARGKKLRFETLELKQVEEQIAEYHAEEEREDAEREAKRAARVAKRDAKREVRRLEKLKAKVDKATQKQGAKNAAA